MYKSPIAVLLQTDFNNRIEDEVMLIITQKYGIDVDKGELLRALNYDRQQYNEGYSDAMTAFEDEIKSIARNLNNASMMTSDVSQVLEILDAFIVGKRSKLI